MSIINASPLIAAGDDGYQIERSLRFNSPDSAYLNRTPASAGNRKTWTWSGWVKRSTLAEGFLFAAGTSNALRFGIVFSAQGNQEITIIATQGGSNVLNLITTPVYRDVSAWYHLVFAVDTTQATSSNRAKLYINGDQVTALATATYPAQNTDLEVNTTNPHVHGCRGTYTVDSLFAGYLTEVNFIDGQALTPSSFGEINPVTGVWGPKKYAGTYGTNGFYLKFADNSGTTSTTLGKDSSGNGNNWTPNNFSVTAGAGNDSMIDVPTPYADGGNGRGNYCTLNPTNRNNGGTAPTIVNGNLETTSAVNPTHIWGTMAVPSSTNSWYWEGVCTSMDTARTYIGIVDPVAGNASVGASYEFIDKAILYNNGVYFNTASGTGGTINGGTFTSYAQNDVVMVAYSNGKIWFGKNGTWMNSGNPAAGTGAVDTGVSTSKTWLPYFGYNSNWTANFGQRAFAYTPPTGFLALNTQNLPEPSIKKPSAYMDAKLYTGNSSTQTISGLGFSPDLVWIKNRTSASQHVLTDTVRGSDKQLFSSLTNSEQTSSTGITAFTSDGFSLGVNVSPTGSTNSSPDSYVAWCWDESATPGFDIVTYTGNGTNRTIAHSLGVAPRMMIVKNRTNGSAAYHWFVYHASIGATDRLLLNTTGATAADSAAWNNTAPTSSVFSVGTGVQTNENGSAFVAYLWSEVANFSKFGSYTGNGSADGPFVHCGFRPAYLMVKRSDVADGWFVVDAQRSPYNVCKEYLSPHLAIQEYSNLNVADFTANGFKIRESNAANNASGGTYIFAAFAESPFKYSLAR